MARKPLAVTGETVTLEEFKRLAKGGNKFHACRTWSELCQRRFDSKAELRRGEALVMMEKAGVINQLRYQVRYYLSEKPKVTYTIDFAYCDSSTGERIREDVKGVLTRDTRTKLAWLQQKYGIAVVLLKAEEV